MTSDSSFLGPVVPDVPVAPVLLFNRAQRRRQRRGTSRVHAHTTRRGPVSAKFQCDLMIARSDVGQPQWRKADEPAVHDDARAARTRVYIDCAACGGARHGWRRFQARRERDIERPDGRRRRESSHARCAGHGRDEPRARRTCRAPGPSPRPGSRRSAGRQSSRARRTAEIARQGGQRRQPAWRHVRRAGQTAPVPLVRPAASLERGSAPVRASARPSRQGARARAERGTRATILVGSAAGWTGAANQVRATKSPPPTPNSRPAAA